MSFGGGRAESTASIASMKGFAGGQCNPDKTGTGRRCAAISRALPASTGCLPERRDPIETPGRNGNLGIFARWESMFTGH